MKTKNYMVYVSGKGFLADNMGDSTFFSQLVDDAHHFSKEDAYRNANKVSDNNENVWVMKRCVKVESKKFMKVRH